MQNKDIFKSLLKKLERQKKGLSDPRIMHPEREWAIGIVAMILVFLGSAYWSSQVYLKNRNVTSAEVPTDEVVVYKEGIVTDVLKRFEKSDETYRQLTQGIAVVEDVPVKVASTTPEVVEVTTPDFSTASSTDVVEEGVLRAQ
jgi:hypothetical protein